MSGASILVARSGGVRIINQVNAKVYVPLTKAKHYDFLTLKINLTTSPGFMSKWLALICSLATHKVPPELGS